ncbi:glycosyltransferase [Verrucomicrobiaceae bacterium 227]
MAKKIVIIANVPIWIIPDLEELRHGGHYCTWLEALIPAFELEKEDFELHWITFSKQVSEYQLKQAFGQYFHVLPRGSLAVGILSKFFWEARMVKRLVAKLQPDLVHAWGSEDVCGIAGSRSGVSKKLFTLQGCLSDYVKEVGGVFLFRVQAMYEKRTVAAYQHGTAESPIAAGLLSGLNPEIKVDIVEYGVHESFHRAKWSPVQQPTVLFVGSVDERKGIAHLIEVAAMPQCAGINFRIAGVGGMKDALMEKATENVTWLGKVDRSKVIAELEEAWVLVIPTFADTGPTVVKEARVVGLPIVITNAAGSSSYVDDSGCGFVIEPGDLLGLRTSILEVCKDREECLRMGSRGWADHRKILSPSTTARSFRLIYERLLSPGPESSRDY